MEVGRGPAAPVQVFAPANVADVEVRFVGHGKDDRGLSLGHPADFGQRLFRMRQMLQHFSGHDIVKRL